MPGVMQPLRDEHAELLPHINAMSVAGAAALRGDLTPARETATFLHEHLIPHATAEDHVLYPVVERFLGAGSTGTMRYDHSAVAGLVAELDALLDRGEAAPREDLVRVLYGLFQLVSVHFAKEEAIYVPLLEANLHQEAAALLFEEMGAAAHAHHP